MSDTVIHVENLGKKYIIYHQQDESYTALREVIAKQTQSFLKTLNPWARSQLSATPTREEFWALQDVSFEIKQGDRVGIIGRNGAGKSTLLKILSRITEPTTGRIRIRGRLASLLEVGTGFHPELTGRENIFLNGAILGMSKVEIQCKFDEIVDFAEIAQFLDTPVKRYSSGMYVRLAFAVAAHLQTDILLVDEVLAVGDAAFQKKCLGKIQDTQSSGRTVILVSHQLGIVKEVCPTGILMVAGRAVLHDAIDAVIARYLNNEKLDQSISRYRYLQSVQCFDGRDRQTHLFFGEPLVIVIELNHLPDLTLGINLSIRNQDGRLICLFSTNPHDGFSLPRQSAIKVQFSMDFCCFAPGEYFIDVALTEPAIRVIEEAQNVATFEVLPKRIGGHWAYESRFGDIFPPHQWQAESCT